MYTGWMIRFPVNRPLRPREEQERLNLSTNSDFFADDRGALINFNSTYIDLIDRRYRHRGGTHDFLCISAATFFCYFLSDLIRSMFHHDLKNYWVVDASTAAIIISAVVFFSYFIFRDFFTYKYYPIRFNRITRKVHAFRHNGPDGALTLNWEDGYFHIGHGKTADSLVDVRCHRMEGDIVKDTFAVGHYFTHEEPVRELWEFIRGYMEDGPEKVKPYFIDLSMKVSFTNCYIHVYGMLGIGSALMRTILLPLTGPYILMRWLVLKSCRTPKWSSVIETESRLDPSDPNKLDQPSYFGEGFDKHPDLMKKYLEQATQKRAGR